MSSVCTLKPALFTRISIGPLGILDAGGDLRDLVAVGQVGGEHLDRDRELGGHLLEPRSVAGDEHEVESLGGQLPGELGADARVPPVMRAVAMIPTIRYALRAP